MAADLGAVEVGFQVDQVGHAVAAVQGVVDDVGHQQRVEAGLLEGAVQAWPCALWLCESVVVACRASWPGAGGFDVGGCELMAPFSQIGRGHANRASCAHRARR